MEDSTGFPWHPAEARSGVFRELPSLSGMRDVCRRHAHRDVGFVLPEHYVPFFPERWNGLLVFAESQNLSKTNKEYVEAPRELDEEARTTRLKDAGGIGTGPWDDGSLPFAIEAACGLPKCEAAVANAVPWSRVDRAENNVGPTDADRNLAAAFWRQLLPVIRPSRIVAAGKVAESVLWRAFPDESERIVHLRLPSPMALSRVSGMFDRLDLLRRFPEVASVAARHPEWAESQNRLFYACHAVSRATKATAVGR